MVIYWPPGLLSKNNLMSDLSFPLKLDINAVYLTVDDKVKLDISSYFHTNDIRILTPFLLLMYVCILIVCETVTGFIECMASMGCIS